MKVKKLKGGKKLKDLNVLKWLLMVFFIFL